MLSLKKIVLSLFSLPDFHKHPGTFFERGRGNSLKQTYAEGDGVTCKMNRDEQGREVQKLEVSSEHTF